MMTMEGTGGGAPPASGSIGAGSAGEPQRAPASLAEAADSADVMAYLCAKYEGSYTRQRLADNHVRLTLTKGDGDAVAGNGVTTRAAVANLLEKLGES